MNNLKKKKKKSKELKHDSNMNLFAKWCNNVNNQCHYSQNGKFSYGYASSAGKRSSMEDFYETRIDGVDGELVGLFGVFDGKCLKFLIFLIQSIILRIENMN